MSRLSTSASFFLHIFFLIKTVCCMLDNRLPFQPGAASQYRFAQTGGFLPAAGLSKNCWMGIG
jgi:hypothetical protein